MDFNEAKLRFLSYFTLKIDIYRTYLKTYTAEKK